MLTRSQAADCLETNRKHLCQMMTLGPSWAIAGRTPDLPNGYFRTVFDSPEELDLLILQLQAQTVSKEEALNLSLVR